MRGGVALVVFPAASDPDGWENPEGGSRGTSIRYPAALQIFRILPDVFEIHKGDLPSRLQHAHNLRNGLAASFATGDIVDRKIGHYGIHRGMGKREFSHVAIAHFHAIGYAFQLRVLQGSLARVVSLVHLRPQIDSEATAARKSFGSADEQ